jgi:hypothetical protein
MRLQKRRKKKKGKKGKKQGQGLAGLGRGKEHVQRLASSCAACMYFRADERIMHDSVMIMSSSRGRHALLTVISHPSTSRAHRPPGSGSLCENASCSEESCLEKVM